MQLNQELKIWTKENKFKDKNWGIGIAKAWSPLITSLDIGTISGVGRALSDYLKWWSGS